MKAKGTILVIRGGAIGDFILTLPVLAALRDRFPDTRLELLAYPNVGPLACRAGLVDDFRPIESRSMAMFFARGGDLPGELVDFFGRCSVVVSYLYDPDEIFRTNVERCSPGQFIQGPHRPNETENVHATEVFLKPLERLAIFDADGQPRLNLRDSATESENLIALHPGSGSENKNWPEARWAELVETIVSQRGERVLLVGGEAEGERLTRLGRMVPRDRLEIARQLPLVELAEKVKFARAFVGHDSGITHLAAALGVPGVALWAESKAAIWRPKSDRMRMVESAGAISRLRLETVFHELETVLGKGAFESGRFPGDDHGK
jgi:heptosyltransferase-3